MTQGITAARLQQPVIRPGSGVLYVSWDGLFDPWSQPIRDRARIRTSDVGPNNEGQKGLIRRIKHIYSVEFWDQITDSMIDESPSSQARTKEAIRSLRDRLASAG